MNFDIEDLNFLEADLSVQEKVSLTFLLYGDSTKLNLSTVIDKLYAFLKDPSKGTFFLSDFAIGLDDWKEYIVDSLRTINAFQILEKLGLARNKVIEMPSKIDSSIKLLYLVAEDCTKQVTEQFQKYVHETLATAQVFDLSYTRFMEFQLLVCIYNDILNVDEEEHKFLLDFFKNNDQYDIIRTLRGEASFLNKPDASIFPSPSLKVKTTDNGFYVIKNGKILIINQQKFTRDESPALKNLLPARALRDRQGTDVDKKALSKLFEDFGYKVKVKDNLAHDKILTTVKKFVEKSSKDGTDAIVVTILSHGSEGTVYGSNSIPVKVKDIKSIMCTELLADLPKVLLIQACQGMDFLMKNPNKPLPQPQIEHDGPTSSTASMFGDFLTFWSSIEGFASFRHTQEGSWFIQSICKNIHKKHEDSHLLDICTDVIQEVSQDRSTSQETMLSKIETTFMKKFVFPGYRYKL